MWLLPPATYTQFHLPCLNEPSSTREKSLVVDFDIIDVDGFTTDIDSFRPPIAGVYI